MGAEYLPYAMPKRQDPTDTVRQNLAELDQRQRMLHAARAFFISELIDELSPIGLPDRDTVLDICEKILPQAFDRDTYASAVYTADLITVCREIAAARPDGYAQIFAELFGEYTPPSDQAQGRVAYVANSYTEQAFMELTGFIKHRRVAYFHHFDDVCQEVNNGLCEYGILPVESSAEGLMAGLFRQIELYGLQICAMCRIKSADDGYTGFALVRKAIAATLPGAYHCLDVLCTPDDPSDVGQILSAASLCGHSILHTATYTGRDGEAFRIRLGLAPDSLYPFLLYLVLFCTDITPIGFYVMK